MSQLKFKNAELSDLPKIVEIYNSTVASGIVTADTEKVSVENKMSWFYEHDLGKRPLWMVFDNSDEVVGWVSFQSFYGRPAYDKTCELSIYLDENSRGKGYGKQILNYCIQEAPKYNIETLLGFIFAHNIPSIKLFESFGFETWGHLPDVAEISGNKISLKILGKKI